jgi:hypothetical protein
MKITKLFDLNKMLATTLIILMSTMSAFAVTSTTVSAHSPAWQIPTWIYVAENPNPVGTGQTLIIFWWLDKLYPTTNGQYGDLVQNVVVTITKPDGTTQVFANQTGGPVNDNFIDYVPTVTGTYSVSAYFPGQTLANANPGPLTNSYNTSPYIGDYYEPSTSTNATFVVQTAPVLPTTQSPLPTSYWATPVNGMNYLWTTVSGNWLGPANPGSGNPTQGNINMYTTAPSTGHIVWTKPIDIGGIAGGVYAGGITSLTPGTSGAISYATGSAYETGVYTPIVIDGILYVNTYDTPRYGYYAIDLATGETLWYHNSTGPLLVGSQTPAHIGGTDIPWTFPQLSFAQVMDYDTPNQSGAKAMLWSTYTYYSPTTSVAAGVLGATSIGQQTYYANATLAKDQISGTGVWQMIDPDTGNWICTLYNVPSSGVQFAPSTMHTDPNGNILIYNLNTATANGYLSMWNSTDAVNYPANNNYTTTPGEAFYWMWRPPVGQYVNAAKYGYDWNVSIPASIVGGSIAWVGDNEILGTTGLTSFQYGTGPYSVWALSLAPSTRGQLLWQKYYASPPALNTTITIGPVDPNADGGAGVFTVRQKETLQWFGYNLHTGDLQWGPTAPSEQFDLYGLGGAIAYGTLYSLGYAGVVHAYNVTTGVSLWNATTNVGGENGPYPYWPQGSGAGLTIADGKVYTTTSEHSYTNPLYTGWSTYCWDAITGQNLWNMTGLLDSTIIIADGYALQLNNMDNQLYCFGKGQTATTVTAPTQTTQQGTKVLIQGTVKDQSPGSTLPIYDSIGQAPGNINSPPVSDQYMTQQMQYLYMQQPAPTNTVGVPVTLYYIDPNNNTYTMGQTTSDAAGQYSYAFTPAIPGTYTVVAAFDGTNSYFASNGETHFNVAAAVATVAPTTTPTSVADMYFIPMSIGIIVLVIIVLVVVVLLMLRKRP